MAKSSEAKCIADFETLAKEKIKTDERLGHIWQFINIGSGEGQTLRDSIEAFKRFRFQPRILTARRDRSTWTTLLGNPVSIPIGISPAITYTSLHADSTATAGRAAARAGTVMVLSSATDFPMENFIAMVPENGHYWAQTYLFRDRRNTLHVVRKAENAGFKALVVTVDSPVDHKYAALNKNNFSNYVRLVTPTPAANVRYINGKERNTSDRMSLEEIWRPSQNAHKEAFCCANWDDLAWLKSQTKLPIVLKGILTAEAARQAASFGVAGIMVSAHGGRQLDGVPAPLDALPDVVNAVKGTNVEVYMDGGIRTGNDVVKALALGARAVFIGRPALYGLVVNGEEGIYEVLKILEKELNICMALCGCSTINEIDRSLVKHESEFHSKM